MAVGERWMASLWPFVQAHLPPAPARVLDLGCGPFGGFVPRLRELGYEALGIDPSAPSGPGFHQAGFEQFESPAPLDAIVASRSLHHVHDVDVIVDRLAAALRPGGALVVVEWAWERLDERSARWCFARLGEPGDDEPDWLERRRDGWVTSGRGWDAYFQGWAEGHGLHRAGRILDALDARFDVRECAYGPYFFAELGFPEAEEQAAIDAGEISATGVRYVGTARR
jgi:SAM-dependent methyltransferase